MVKWCVRGKRVGEPIRGKMSYLGWSVTKVNSESKKDSLIEALKNKVGNAPIQIVELTSMFYSFSLSSKSRFNF